MGKRSDFERNPRDFYPTPYEAVLPLLAHLPAGSSFVEPCAGDGRLIRHIEKHGHKCVFASDVFPEAPGIEQLDVLFFGAKLPPADFVITNPPWDREILHPMINKFTENGQKTWLLFDADWMFTGQAEPFKRYCEKIVTVGRVSWMENGQSGKDNCCWYLFGDKPVDTIFI